MDTHVTRVLKLWHADPEDLAGHDDAQLLTLISNLRALWSVLDEGAADTSVVLDRLLRAVTGAHHRGLEIPWIPFELAADAAGLAVLGVLDPALVKIFEPV